MRGDFIAAGGHGGLEDVSVTNVGDETCVMSQENEDGTTETVVLSDRMRLRLAREWLEELE